MGIQERKEREKERRNEELIDAAQKVFKEKGLNAATMDEIAEAAEVSKATLYLHYASKEDLYLAVMMRGVQLLHSMFRVVINQPSPIVQKLNDMKEAYVSFFNNHRDYFRMLNYFQSHHFHKQVSEETRAACYKETEKGWEQIIGLFQAGMHENRIRNDMNAAEMAVVIWSCTAALMNRIDNEYSSWKTQRNVDLASTLETSFRLMFEAILTPEGRREYAALRLNEPQPNNHS